MKNKTKKIILYIFLFSFLFSGLYTNGLRDLEVNYPDATFSTTATSINEYVLYIFNFVVGIAGSLAFLSLAIAGFQYLTSIGDPVKTQDAFKRIRFSFLGLLIILGSWVILYRINYNLINLSNPETSPIPPVLNEFLQKSPILFCKIEIDYINDIINEQLDVEYRMNILREITDNCIFIYKGPVLKFNNYDWKEPEFIYIFPNRNETHYGVILYSKNYEEGQVVYNTTDYVKRIIPMNNPIFFTDPFSMIKKGSNSYGIRREIKIYKYYQGKENPFNIEINNKEINQEEPIFYTEEYSTTNIVDPSVPTIEIVPVKTFFWGSFKIIGSVDINRTFGYIPKTIIVFFPFETMSGPPNWDEGESSKIFVITERHSNLNATAMKNWGKWIENVSSHSLYDCSDQDPPPSCGLCNWVWENGENGPEWNNISNPCVDPCRDCPTPAFNGNFTGETDITFCEEPEGENDQEELIILPCAAGMIIISGQFGIH